MKANMFVKSLFIFFLAAGLFLQLNYLSGQVWGYLLSGPLTAPVSTPIYSSPSPTISPSPTASASPSALPSATPSATPSASPSATPTPSPIVLPNNNQQAFINAFTKAKNPNSNRIFETLLDLFKLIFNR